VLPTYSRVVTPRCWDGQTGYTFPVRGGGPFRFSDLKNGYGVPDIVFGVPWPGRRKCDPVGLTQQGWVNAASMLSKPECREPSAATTTSAKFIDSDSIESRARGACRGNGLRETGV
jgi:hypothetical protein